MVSEDNSPAAEEGGPTGDQVEEIYWAIAELQRLYVRARDADDPDAELPPLVRALLDRIRGGE